MKPVNKVTEFVPEAPAKGQGSTISHRLGHQAARLDDRKNCGNRREEALFIFGSRISDLGFSPKRLLQFVKFCMVGGSGVFVDMGILYLLADAHTLGLNVTFSKICAAEVAMINNFIWNEFWTFRPRAIAPFPDEAEGQCERAQSALATRRACSTLFHRFTLFNAFCGIGIGLAVLLLHAFHTWLGWNLYLSNLLAIILVTFWNFGMNARFNWPLEKSFHVRSLILPVMFINLLFSVPAAKASAAASLRNEFKMAPTLARISKTGGKDGFESISGCCHILLFYGLGATDLRCFPSGQDALKALTDEGTAIAVFGKSPFITTRTGVHYFLAGDPVFHSTVGEAHRDQCLATFAALGLPLGTPIRLKSRSYTIRDLLADSVANFTFDQREPSWTAVAYARLLPPRKSWTNRFGENTSFSQLVDYLVRLDPSVQSCSGAHILQALVEIERADARESVLDLGTRRKLDSFLDKTVQHIVRSQKSDGSWDNYWQDSSGADTNKPTSFKQRVVATGHLLEILNEISVKFRPASAVYTEAAGWLNESLDAPSIIADGSWICPVTHAARSSRQVIGKSDLARPRSGTLPTAQGSAVAERKKTNQIVIQHQL